MGGSNQSINQLRYGKVAIAIGFLVTVIPYLYRIGMVILAIGFILLANSNEPLRLKVKWILIPIVAIATLYYIRTS